MSTKSTKKRSNSEADPEQKLSDQSPPKKQKKLALKKKGKPDGGVVPKVEKTEGENVQVLTAAQRKRLATKNRKLAAIARVKESGGVPKSLWSGKKQKGLESGMKKPEEGIEKVVKKDNKNPSADVKKLTPRQEKRQQDGQYKVEQVTLSPDEIRLRINEIQGRGEISKTARRKLAVLVKKLAILEGTAVGSSEANKAENGDETGLSKSEKRRLRRDKKGLTVEKEKDLTESDDPEVEKPVDIQIFEKKKKAALLKKGGAAEKTSSLVQQGKRGDQKNKKQILSKPINKANKKIVKEAESSDNEDDDDDDEDEDEDDGATVPGIEEDAKEESSEDDDEEDEEEEDDEEEEEDDDEEDAEVSDAARVEVTQKTVKKKETKGKREQGGNLKKQLDQEQNSDKKKRYILFVGNIAFNTKPEELKTHFLTKVGDVTSVRIPTNPGTQVPRGFGYVEVSNEVDYEKGLSLHHTFLNSRRINVEYTLGGSKQVSKRKELVSKNQKLHALRKAGKLAGSQKHDQKRSVRRFKKREQERGPK